jgi:hypothetical protein
MTYLVHLFVNIYPRQYFLWQISDNYPNFLKADVDKAKQNFKVDNLDDPVENQFENEMPQQPDWMELIKTKIYQNQLFQTQSSLKVHNLLGFQ